MLVARKFTERSLIRNVIPFFLRRDISATAPNFIKEIRESRQGNVVTFEGVTVASLREPYLVQTDESHEACPICSSGLDVKHTDVLILCQFVRTDGCMLPRRVTGLCKKQQKRISTLVTMAQKAGLMPNLGPASSKKDPRKRYKWKSCNTYFDETTIKV